MASIENMHDVTVGSETLLWQIVVLILRTLLLKQHRFPVRSSLSSATLREIVMHHLDSHGLLAMQHAVQACQHMQTAQK